MSGHIGYGWITIPNSSNILNQYKTKIYHNSAWRRYRPMVYTNGAWIQCGQTNNLITRLCDSAGKFVIDSSGNNVYVRDPKPEKPASLSVTKTYTGGILTNNYITPEHVTMTGDNSGTERGTYTATYTLDTGYAWRVDKSTDSITVTLTIV